MAFDLADRVVETSTTTGTGTYDLGGVPVGFGAVRTFVAGVGDGNSTYYAAYDGNDWEIGIGTVTDAAPDTLSRDTILDSSNAGAAVNWGAGTKFIFCQLPATMGEWFDLGTVSSGTETLNIRAHPLAKLINGGAFTLAPGSDKGAGLLVLTNNASAGSVTLSGWTNVFGDGDLTTVNGDKFLCHCVVDDDGDSWLDIRAEP